jgi:2-polyprenyl-3-methyl-5-hydroxy-6-metoxy-1,4-benzoquinol methylase
VPNVYTLQHPDGTLAVQDNGFKRLLRFDPSPGIFAPYKSWETSYPFELIKLIFDVKGAWSLDEIKRDEDHNYVRAEIYWEMFSYVSSEEVNGATLLDFGSGCGSSSMVMSRLLPRLQITGIELLEKFISIARERARFYGVEDRVTFLHSPSGDEIPDCVGQFDFVFFCGVYEHLLPQERKTLLPLIWQHLKPGGVMFMNQLPYRWFPVEHHTTRLPLINYLPQPLAFSCARYFSNRIDRSTTDEELLRMGIRGGTHREIFAALNTDGRKAAWIEPHRLGVSDHMDLWYSYSNSLNPSSIRKPLRLAFKLIKTLSGAIVVPYVSLAVRKAH